MIRLIFKAILLAITLVTIGVPILGLFQIQTLGDLPVGEKAAMYTTIAGFITLAIVYLIFHIKSLGIFSKIYNIENRDLSDRRPINRNIETRIHKIYWISGIIMAGFTSLLSTIYAVYCYQLNTAYSPGYGYDILDVVSIALSISITLTLWIILDLVGCMYYLRRYKQSHDDEISEIGVSS